MPRWLLETIGLTAGVCTTFSLLPQLVRIWRRRSADDISLTMFLMFSFGVCCWLVYGIYDHSLSMVIANSVTLVLALAILALKLRFRN